MDSAGTHSRCTHRNDRLGRVSEHDMDELELVVGGMACRRCVREVTARLRDVPGVERVSADPLRSEVHLRGSMTESDVLAAFAGTTYRPVVVA
jgi:copper chaperone CopZ